MKQSDYQPMMLPTDHGDIHFLLARSRRRTLEVQVKDDGQVYVRIPNRLSKKDLCDFIEKRALWIKQHSFRRKVQHERSQKVYAHGELFWFLGRQFPLDVNVFSKKRVRVEFLNDRWVVLVPEGLNDVQDKIKRQMWSWYQQQAKEVFGVRLFHYARLMEEEPKEILIRKQKRIWGCCDKAAGVISLNWQLIQAPIWVIDYVIVHELAHLKHANHSALFWNRVAKFFPEYEQAKDWLKAHQVDITLN